MRVTGVPGEFAADLAERNPAAQGRRDSPYLDGMGTTEDTAMRSVSSRPSGDGLPGATTNVGAE